MPHRQSFAALRRQYRDGSLSPLEVARSALAHAARIDATLNAFARLDGPRAEAAAQASARRWRSGHPRGALDGMPLTVKESFAVQGWPLRRASLTADDEPAPRSAVHVQRLEAAGAVLLGHTRAPEFNWKGVTDSPGFGITRNPWNPVLTPGGSSGGCAAAVASGVVRASFGSDAGGSVRIPAAFCGVLGLKPTHGLIPMVPPPVAFSGTAHVGLLGASAADMLDALQAVSGTSAQDGCSRDEPAAARAVASIPVQHLRIGLLHRRHWQQADASVQAAMALCIERFAREGMACREVDVGIGPAAQLAQRLYRLGCARMIDRVAPSSRALMDAGLLAWTCGALAQPLGDYLAWLEERERLRAEFLAVFDDVDILLLPTLPLTAFAAGLDAPPGFDAADWFTWNPYTPAFNALQVPALSVPVWSPGAALPAGVQFVAARDHDRRLLALAAWLETWFPVRLAPSAHRPNP